MQRNEKISIFPFPTKKVFFKLYPYWKLNEKLETQFSSKNTFKIVKKIITYGLSFQYQNVKISWSIHLGLNEKLHF